MLNTNLHAYVIIYKNIKVLFKLCQTST